MTTEEEAHDLPPANVFVALDNNNRDTSLESETEDEEVKMNCIGGSRGFDESDMNTTDASDHEDSDGEEEKLVETDRYVLSC